MMLGTSNIRWGNKDGARPAVSTAPGAGEGQWPDAPALLRRVLVVDDEQDLADITSALLGAHGLEVVTAYSARDALRLLQEHGDIDAIFSDIVMPGMSGIELAELVREMYPKVKIVLASGYAQPKLVAERDRSFLYTSKPYRLDTILKLLRT